MRWSDEQRLAFGACGMGHHFDNAFARLLSGSPVAIPVPCRLILAELGASP
jgi:hypothetical protein